MNSDIDATLPFSPLTNKIVVAVIACLVTWRIWNFTLRPIAYPNEPKELPYWIPFFGHVVGFFTNFDGALGKGRQYFKDSNQPYSLTVAGQTIYVATSAKDIGDVWKNSTSISLNPISMDLYRMMGISGRHCEALFQPHSSACYNQGNPRPLTPTQMVIELHHQQLHSGSKIDDLIGSKVLPDMMQHMDFSAGSPAVLHRSGKAVTVSLLKLCVDVFIRGETEAYFGPKLLQIHPDLPQSFMDWEYSNWKLLFQLPAIFAKDMVSARGAIAGAFTDYFRLPREERPGATIFVTELEYCLREVGLDEVDMGKFMLLHYWAIVGNAYKLGFWLVAYLLQDIELLQNIRQEVVSAVTDDSIDERHLLERCPNLESLVSETLRLKVTSSLGRVVTEDTIVGGKLLRKGNKIMLPIRGLHFDKEVWGVNADSLSATRFLENPKAAKSLSYRPWGGGHTLCPGRFLARRSVNAFVAVLLGRYDVALENERFPKGDGARPSPGVLPVGQGEDLVVRLTPRMNA